MDKTTFIIIQHILKSVKPYTHIVNSLQRHIQYHLKCSNHTNNTYKTNQHHTITTKPFESQKHAKMNKTKTHTH